MLDLDQMLIVKIVQLGIIVSKDHQTPLHAQLELTEILSEELLIQIVLIVLQEKLVHSKEQVMSTQP
jgi:hypothetical protein